MNALLAASPTLTLRTYTVCTALSLFKVIIHTTIGASIHSFAGYNLHKTIGEEGGEAGSEDEEELTMLGHVTAFVGIFLCIAIIIYLSWVARKAVDEELDDEVPAHDSEESQRFLNPDDLESGAMAESPFTNPLRGGGHSMLRSMSLPIDDHRGRREDERQLGLRTF